MDGTHLEPIDLYMMANIKNSDYLLTDRLRIYRVDVPFFANKCYNQDVEVLDYKDKFIGLIGINNKKLASQIVSGDKIMSDIKKKIEDCNKDTDILEEYDYRHHQDEIIRLAFKEEVEKGLKESFEEGIKEGIQNKTYEIAKNLLSKNIDINMVADVTGLSLEELNKIIEK